MLGWSTCSLSFHDVSLPTCRYRRAADIDKQSPSGCCIKGIGSTNRAIYTRQRKCSQLYESNTFHVATCESLRSKYVLAIDHAACCTGFLGQCQMMTFADCTSVEGQYHRNRTCLQVSVTTIVAVFLYCLLLLLFTIYSYS